MRNDRIRLAALLWPLLALSLSPSAGAQTPFYGPRGAAMAGASTAVADDGTALWTNPAGLARATRTDLELFGGAAAADRASFLAEAGGLSGLDPSALARDPAALERALGRLRRLADPGTGLVGSGAAGFVFGWSGLALGVGDVAYAGIYPNVDLAHVLPGNDPATSVRFNGSSVRSAGLEAREARLGLSKAFFGKTLLVGVAVRYVRGRAYYLDQRVFDASFGNPLAAARRALRENATDTSRLAFDVGAMVNILGKLRVGAVSAAINQPTFSVRRDPGNPRLAGAPESLRLPRTLRAGAAFEPLGALTVAVDGDLVASDTLVPGGKSRQVSAGLEVRLLVLAIRAGAFRDVAAPDPHWAYSAGVGLGLPMLSVNAAIVFSTYNGLSLSSANQRDVGLSVDGRFRF